MNAHRDKPRLAAGWLLVPVLTWGTFAWAPFLYVAIRARSKAWGLIATIYLAIVVTILPAEFLHPERLEAPHADFYLHWALTVCATIHLALITGAFSRRLRVLEHPGRQAAEHELLAREEARRLISQDPLRARELKIGRPDLGATFDGGLIDVNHVPSAVLAQLPDMDHQTAARIAQIRDELRGFSSLEDFDQVIDLPTETIDRWRPIAVFLP